MKIIVCLKQVPDTSEVRIDPNTNTLIRTGIPTIINPFDENALEEALRLRETHGGTVTAISMGPPQAVSALRDALALGVDHVILLSDPKFAGADTYATSFTISRAIQKIGQADVVLCGRQAIDGDTGQTGPEISGHLGIPLVSNVRKIKIESRTALVEKIFEDGYEVIEVRLPALFTVVKEINVPRLPGLKGKIASKNAVITIWSAQDLGIEDSQCGLKGSPTFVRKIFIPGQRAKGEILTGDPKSVAHEAVKRLKNLRLIS